MSWPTCRARCRARARSPGRTWTYTVLPMTGAWLESMPNDACTPVYLRSGSIPSSGTDGQDSAIHVSCPTPHGTKPYETCPGEHPPPAPPPTPSPAAKRPTHLRLQADQNPGNENDSPRTKPAGTIAKHTARHPSGPTQHPGPPSHHAAAPRTRLGARQRRSSHLRHRPHSDRPGMPLHSPPSAHLSVSPEVWATEGCLVLSPTLHAASIGFHHYTRTHSETPTRHDRTVRAADEQSREGSPVAGMASRFRSGRMRVWHDLAAC